MKNLLTLDVDGKCDDKNEETCKCTGASTLGIKAKKEAVPGVTNFTRYTHSVPNGRTFRLSRNLGHWGIIKATKGRDDDPINDVESVSVYYWNGDPTRPLLLGIKQNDNHKTKYYSKSSGMDGSWLNGPVSTFGELDALDDQNCRRNNAIPIDLTNPDGLSQFYPDNRDRSTCLRGKSIDKSSSKSLPPGSEKDYEVKGYQVKGSTKISRVTYDYQPTNIILPYDDSAPLLNIYYWRHEQGSEKPPRKALLVEITTTDTKNKTKYYVRSKSDGNDQWSTYSNRNSQFRLSEEDIEQKLDYLTCEHHNAVTLDLTKNYSKGLSEKYATGDKKYCCDKHEAESAGRIAVTKGEITANSKTISYYKHETNHNLRLAGIKYYNEDDNDGGERNRRRITAKSLLKFPLSDVKAVYVFYCQKPNPLLIYIEDGSQNGATGWYQRKSSSADGNEEWEKVHLPGVTLDTINDCSKWIQLKNALEKAGGCKYLETCTPADTDNLLQSEQQMQHNYEQDEQPQEDESDKEDEKEAGVGETVTHELQESVSDKARGAAPEAQPQGPPSPGPSPDSQNTNNSNSTTTNIIKTTISVTTGFLGTSALACFTLWKLYNRYRGDPLVRQI